jgi:hypothetical protein
MAEYPRLSTPVPSSEERATEVPNYTFLRLTPQDPSENSADAVLRPTKGGLRCSVTHKFAFFSFKGIPKYRLSGAVQHDCSCYSTWDFAISRLHRISKFS